MQRLSTVNVYVWSLCVCLLGKVITVLYMYACVGAWSMVYACNCCCRSRGFVEAYRDLLELVCEACK